VQRKIAVIMNNTITTEMLPKQAISTLVDAAVASTIGSRALECYVIATAVVAKQLVQVGLSMRDPLCYRSNLHGKLSVRSRM
jgi:hypothetical protein